MTLTSELEDQGHILFALLNYVGAKSQNQLPIIIHQWILWAPLINQ